jgi:antitoxin MazE
MQSIIRKWGNSPALRLSAHVMKTAAFEVDQRVSIKATRGRIIIEPTRDAEVRIEDLVDGITPENRHGEVDFGPPVGRETL